MRSLLWWSNWRPRLSCQMFFFFLLLSSLFFAPAADSFLSSFLLDKFPFLSLFLPSFAVVVAPVTSQRHDVISCDVTMSSRIFESFFCVLQTQAAGNLRAG